MDSVLALLGIRDMTHSNQVETQTISSCPSYIRDMKGNTTVYFLFEQVRSVLEDNLLYDWLCRHGLRLGTTPFKGTRRVRYSCLSHVVSEDQPTHRVVPQGKWVCSANDR